MILCLDCSSHLDSSKNMAARGRSLFSLYIYIENCKNLLVRNHWTDFNIILQKCSFSDPLPRLFKPFGFVKNMAARGRGLFSLNNLYRKNLKIFLSETTGPISIYHGRNVSFVTFSKDCSRHYDSSKNMAASGGGAYFPIYLYRKLSKSSCQKPLDRLLYNVAKMFPW